MDYIRVNIYPGENDLDLLINELCYIGVTGLEIEDPDEFNTHIREKNIYRELIDDSLIERLQERKSLKFYLPKDNESEDRLRAIISGIQSVQGIDFEQLEIKLDNVRDEDWANNWKKYFKPLQIGDNLIIKPEWEEYDNIDNKTVVNIDPGMAFGTGTHESTRLCLEAAQKYISPKTKKVLDIGCGSGILSIASLLLGADYASGIDIDPVAVKVAYENASINNIPTPENSAEPRYTVYSGDILNDGSARHQLGSGYDLVFANIIADVIIPLTDILRHLIKSGGIFIASGIIDTRENEVVAALDKNNFRTVEILRDNGWVCIISELI